MGGLRLDDTIAAIATAPGEGAVGMVRISGPEALAIGERLFRSSRRGERRPARPGQRRRSHQLYHGHVVDPESGAAVDEVLVAFMRGPRTYTRQDVVEITGHGGGVSVREILRLVVAAGARPAERGEMTLRAFLSGRLDLAQAEAVLDAVRARTPGALSLATGQLAGGLSRAIAGVRQDVLEVFAHLEATIDFAEDDVPPLPRDALLEPLQRAEAKLSALLATARAGRLVREGMRVAIVGRPNVGKSSLLNALLQTDRAIVTPIPGTTRDVIEETIDLDGVPVALADTAGIGETDDPVERIGVARSREALAAADFTLLVVDGSTPLTGEDGEIGALVRAAAGPGTAIVVLSKADLPHTVQPEAAQDLAPGGRVVRVSSATGAGLGELRQALRQAALGGDGAPALGTREAVVASARHRDALERARQALWEAMRAAEQELAADLVCIDLRACLAALGEVTGESVTEDLLERIFSQFCIGKLRQIAPLSIAGGFQRPVRYLWCP